jgi:type II secretory ATPase GspE/PulE/Tfp pilus assembly ATPase PilB-like protein
MTDEARATALNMDQIKIDPQVALSLPAAVAIRRQILPFSCKDDVVYVACADLDDAAGLDAVQRITGKTPVPTLAEPASLQRAISRVYSGAQRDSRGGRTGSRGHSIDLNRPAGDMEGEDAVELGNELLHAAVMRQASDIHIEPGKEGVRIRFRVDGELADFRTLPASRLPSLISRLKVLSGMDIAEKRAPQDGGFSHRYGSGASARTVDIRSATLPTRYGERMTLRLLALGAETLTLENLGMLPADHRHVERLLLKPHGLVLLTGPTGSGKSTTLYAIIRKLAAGGGLNIITVEDPIEYEIAGVSQVEVEAADKVNFSKALRSILRHDPDVLMIGEIRDEQTLDVAVKASLTGHLVLSTLHTNSAAGVVTRLVDMGAQRYLLAATLQLAVAQRLVRRLCQHPGCRRERQLTEAQALSLGSPAKAGQTVYDAGGCMYCDGRGYSGRVGLFELMPVEARLAEQITAGVSEGDLEAARVEQGFATLRQDAVAKVLAGRISLADAVEAVGTA